MMTVRTYSWFADDEREFNANAAKRSSATMTTTKRYTVTKDIGPEFGPDVVGLARYVFLLCLLGAVIIGGAGYLLSRILR